MILIGDIIFNERGEFIYIQSDSDGMAEATRRMRVVQSSWHSALPE